MTERLTVRCRPAGATLDLVLPGEDAEAAGVIKVEPRTLIWRRVLPDGTPAILKLYRRRRFFEVAPLRIGPQRVRREFDALRHLEAKGVPCTEPLFWGEGRTTATGAFEILATREIPDAVPLRDWLPGRQPEPRDATLRTAFRLVRTMHAAGVSHGSLSFKNLLVVPGEPDPDVVLVDLARAVVFSRDIAGTRVASFDLDDLARKVIEELGMDAARTFLAEYGLSADAADALARSAEHHRPRQHRQRRFFETRLRHRIGAVEPVSAREPVLPGGR